MLVSETLGFIAAICTTLSFLPQVLKVLKTRDTKALSLSMYVVFVFGVSLWLVYGILKSDLPITVANSFTLLFACIILFVKVQNRKRDKLH